MDTKKIVICLMSLLPFVFGCATAKEADVPFKYGTIIQKAFGELGDGREIPVTIEKATEIDGSVTADGQYLYFSSDRERGNFDIYLRSMTDITTVRLTSHPSKDTSPAVSPDGKNLAFVSTREDPQGDIYVMKLDAKKMIEEAASSQEKSYDGEARNISELTDPVSLAPMSVKDADPCWSPDGGSVVFSSTRGDGAENLWICSKKGKDLRRLTSRGGLYPRFSQDGTLVVFVSYRDNPQGEIYSFDIASGKETRLTSMAGVKLYPSFGSSNGDIIFTLIDRDTNGDGAVDFKDMSVLCRYDAVKKLSYPLTLYSSSSFRGRWFPAFAQKYLNTNEDNFKGVLFYSSQSGDNININVLPEYGIIPKRKTASDQLSLAEAYLRDEGESDKYLMALLRVYYYFGDRKDVESEVFASRALYRAAAWYLSQKEMGHVKTTRNLLSAMAQKKNSFASVTREALDLLVEGKRPYAAYSDIVRGEGKERPDFVYLLDDAAQACTAAGDTKTAVELYQRIVKEYPSYKKLGAVNYALAQIVPSKADEISPYYLEVVRKAEPFLRDKAVMDVVRFFKKEKDPGKRIQLASKFYPSSAESAREKQSKEDNALTAILDYVTGAAYAEKEDFRSAEDCLSRALTKLRTSEVLYYDTNLLLASIAFRNGDPAAVEKYQFNAVTNYLNRWNKPGFTDTVLQLIGYYESAGAELEYSGDYKKAAELYQRYVKIITYLHWLKKFEPLYNEYGARAHVLYINAAADLPGDTSQNLKNIESQYVADKLDIARLNFDKAHIYGLAWIYAKMGIDADSRMKGFTINVTESDIAECFRKSAVQLDWALFMDDIFCDPYILQGWINQYIDLRRDELSSKDDFRAAAKYDRFFPRYLWERNKSVYQKGLDVNDEVKYPDKEGSLHLNFANTQFLLGNYPSAFEHYRLAAKYKKNFGSRKEEALFRYHYGYCLWQNGDVKGAKQEMRRVLDLYASSGASRSDAAQQRCIIYRYLALFERSDRNYEKALEWYSKLVDESARFKVKTDLSRTYIDMAWCCEQTGNEARAISFLSRAGDILEKADDNDPAYKLQWKIFGVLPVEFGNLGADSMVIGDSRMFGALSVAQQKLLVESSMERIAVRGGDYVKAREHIKRRLDILDGRSSSVDTDMTIRAINSDGYCLFMLGRYAEAKARFEEAFEAASDADVTNAEGMSASIQNLVELYAFSCENGNGLLKNPPAELEALKKRLLKFRSDYESIQYEKERKKIEAEAESRDVPVKQSDLDAAKKRIGLEAASKYPEMDLSAATLDFYSAEYSSASDLPLDPLEAYKSQSSLFRTYADTAALFEESASASSVSLPKKAKLILNAVVCREKTGMYEKAYELLGLSEQAAADSAREDVLWTVYRREALFLRDSGEAVDDDNLRTSARYFEKACAIIETAPALYASQSEMIRSLYDDYAVLSIRRGDFNAALRISERGYAVERILSVTRSGSSFEGTQHGPDYSGYQNLLSLLRASMKGRAELAAAGVKEGAQVAKADADVVSARSALASFGKELAARNPLFASYCFVRGDLPSASDLGQSAVYFFLQDGDTCYAWKLSSNGITSRLIPSQGGSFVPGAAAFMGGDGKTAPRFVVLNDTAERIFAKSREGLPPFTFIPSSERVRFFTGGQQSGFGPLASAGHASENELRVADILTGTAEECAPVLRSRKADPSLCVAVVDDGTHMRSVIDAMLLTNCRSALLFKGTNPVSKKENIAALGAGVADVNLSNASCFASGAASSFVHDTSAVAALRSQLRGKSAAALEVGDGSSAFSFYGKYRSVASEASPSDMLLLARIEELNGDYASAEKDAAASAADGDAERLSWAVYLALKNGDCQSAGEILFRAAGQPFSSSPDCALFRAIIARAQGEDSELKLEEGNGFVPRDKLSLLLHRYALVFGEPAGKVVLVSPSSADDGCVSAMSGSLVRPSDQRASRICAFLSGKRKSGDEALALGSVSGGYDRLSVYPVLAVLNDRLAAAGTADATFLRSMKPEFCAAAARLDRVRFLSLCAESFRRAGLAEEERTYLGLLEAELGIAGMPGVRASVLLRKAESFALSGAYKDAASVLKAADPAFMKRADLHVKYELLSAECEIFMKEYASGISRLEKLDASEPSSKAVREVLLAHAERLKIIDVPAYAAEGFPRYESHMKKAVLLLDPSLFGRGKGLREDLLRSGLDFMVSFCMRKGDSRSAILYAELKRQVALWSLTAGLSCPPLPAAAEEAYASSKTAAAYAEALALFPALAYEKKILFSPLEAFQKKLSYDCAAIVISRNENDLFVWVIDRESVQPLRIAGGYEKASTLISEYEAVLREMRPVSVVSAGLGQLFAPVMSAVRDRRIYVVADEFTEKIPFEIIGGKTAGGAGRVAFLGSLAGSLGGFSAPDPVCELRGTTALDEAAVRESGIGRGSKPGGIAHFGCELTNADGVLSASGVPVAGVLKEKALSWIGGTIPFDSQTVFSMEMFRNGDASVLINDASERGVGGYYFVSVFYERLAAGLSLEDAYDAAVKALLESQTWSHPVYWEGIRLYLRGTVER